MHARVSLLSGVPRPPPTPQWQRMRPCPTAAPSCNQQGALPHRSSVLQRLSTENELMLGNVHGLQKARRGRREDGREHARATVQQGWGRGKQGMYHAGASACVTTAAQPRTAQEGRLGPRRVRVWGNSGEVGGSRRSFVFGWVSDGVAQQRACGACSGPPAAVAVERRCCRSALHLPLLHGGANHVLQLALVGCGRAGGRAGGREGSLHTWPQGHSLPRGHWPQHLSRRSGALPGAAATACGGRRRPMQSRQSIAAHLQSCRCLPSACPQPSCGGGEQGGCREQAWFH